MGEICHVCLDKSFSINNNICTNDSCTGYICKNCMKDLVKNNISECILCRQQLYDVEDVDSINEFNKKINSIITIYDIIKNIIGYITFYSIGGSSIIILMIIIYNYDFVVNIIIYENHIMYYIISLFIFPIFGLIVWYLSILIILYIKSIKINYNTNSDSDIDSDSDSDSDSDYFDNILI